MSAKHILVILNPVSGQGKYEDAKEAVEDALRKSEIPYQLRETKGEGDAFQWAKEAEDFDLIMVGGGDGTVMEAMSGCIANERHVPLAQLPMGTANLLARALAIPTRMDKALELALSDGVATSMDVGYLPDHERYFALVAGSGWDAQLIADADRDLKNKLGFLAYIFAGVKNLFRLQNSRVRLLLDGKEFQTRAHTVEVINVGEIYGTGIALGEGLSPHDGKLDLAIITSNRWRGIFRLLWRLITKRFGDDSTLRYFTAARIRIEADPPLKLQIDGEAIGETPYEVIVIPDGANLVVPREYVEAKKLEFREL